MASHLVALCQLLARGEAPAPVASHLAGTRLHALPKKQGGVRPIAVGETLRRLVSKVLCQAVREDEWVDRNQADVNKVLLKVDFKNAFNSVDRLAILSETRAAFPGLACWADWCYTSSSALLFGKHTLQSSQGVQGDPLGPLLFSAALQPALRQAAQCPVELCFSICG